MHCCDTGTTIPAVRLEHLNVKGMTRLNDVIGKLKRSTAQGNAWLLLFLSGGNVGDIKPLVDVTKVLKD